jgi:glucose-6-phosphate 1-dehydrogenase
VVFKEPPSLGFSSEMDEVDPNQFVLLIDPYPAARLILHAKAIDGPGLRPVNLDIDLRNRGEAVPAPYEVLLHAAMQGDQSHFTREDSVEETWRVLEPLLEQRSKPAPYAPGSWGPASAEALTREHGGWHQPWTPQQEFSPQG